ncbi:hypothetical protein GWK36_06190 [Caldichromatium japonicum]|uniref:Uncharacterized protein n=1 Tax=Caldichromatium japonicum TaxID=2699430 RepID=A0A6G7VCQ7_9GAMM|nr:hypothetical protein [Caldichromatium japonicum]QIK37638.1 hypothetical protein GWK36_06190 [Caldichromatium japonicum]
MRLLSFAAREERRRQVVSLRRRSWRYEAIGAQRGLLGAGVFDICKGYGREGAQELKDKQGGRKSIMPCSTSNGWQPQLPYPW